LVIGGDDTIATGVGYGPNDERQILGVNKPVFGFSFRTNTGGIRGELSDLGLALHARAVELTKRGEEVTPESVMRARKQVVTSRIISLARGGATIEEIARKTGKSETYVGQLLKFAGVVNDA
jgi:hypothetical protein